MPIPMDGFIFGVDIFGNGLILGLSGVDFGFKDGLVIEELRNVSERNELGSSECIKFNEISAGRA
jgi:hypothetical protein